MFDALLTKAKIASTIAQLGSTVSITSAGTKVFSGKAVFVSKTIQRDTSDPTSQISTVINATSLAYIAATGKVAPLPGDILAGKNREYLVSNVTVYQPADVVIAYRLELQ